MPQEESIFDILDEKVDKLRYDQLEKARHDPHQAAEMYVTGLYPEVEGFLYPLKTKAENCN